MKKEKKVKNLKVNWIPALAIAFSVFVVSCMNEEETKKTQGEIESSRIQAIQDAYMEERTFLNEQTTISIDELTSEFQEEEASFSK